MSDRKRFMVTLGLVGLIVLGVGLLIADHFGAAGFKSLRPFGTSPIGTGVGMAGKGMAGTSGRPSVPDPDARDSEEVRAAKAVGVAWAKSVLAGLSNPALTMSKGITTPVDQEVIRRALDEGSNKVFRYGFIDPTGVLVLATRPEQLGKVVVSETALAALKQGNAFAYSAQDVFIERSTDAATLSPTVVVLFPAFEGDRYLGAVSVHVDAREGSGL